MCFNCFVLYFSLVYVGSVKATVSALLSLVVLPTVRSLITVHIRYDTIGEFNVDSKAEYSALSSTRSQKRN